VVGVAEVLTVVDEDWIVVEIAEVLTVVDDTGAGVLESPQVNTEGPKQYIVS